jgi:flagellar FliL protein
VMQATVAIMTHYDDRVVNNVEKHDFPLRFAMLAAMRKVTEADIADAEFQTILAASLKIEMNAVLESLEDFGGIEAVYFTEFVVQ